MILVFFFVQQYWVKEVYLTCLYRAVAKFLQTVLTKEVESGRNALSMDSLLVGKKRKEASRMFFEALVCSNFLNQPSPQTIPYC